MIGAEGKRQFHELKALKNLLEGTKIKACHIPGAEINIALLHYVLIGHSFKKRKPFLPVAKRVVCLFNIPLQNQMLIFLDVGFERPEQSVPILDRNLSRYRLYNIFLTSQFCQMFLLNLRSSL